MTFAEDHRSNCSRGCVRRVLAGLHGMRSAFSHKLLNLTYDSIEFIDEVLMIAMPAKRGDQRAVIPKRPLFFSAEPFENFRTRSAELSEDRARVMQFIRGGNQPCRRIGIVQMLDVSPFSFQPRRLRRLARIGATIDDTRNLIAKFLADIAQSFGAAATFHRVMQ